jgi:hypothetical protein
VLLYGHAKNAYWYGSQLSIEETRALAPYQNATGLQVTSAVLAGMVWALENPEAGIVEADEMDYRRCLEVQTPYLGPVKSATTPTGRRSTDRPGFFPEDIDESDPWQFRNVLVRFRRFRSQLGYMFQGVIRQHPQLVEAAGPTVASVRPFVIIGEGGPRIVAMTWKVPAPGNFSDNTLHPGNMLANVDIETGTVTRVVRGAGVALEVLEHNPATGQRLVGFRLPHFEKLKTVVLEGAALIPGIRIQGWDVALGPDGPIVVEVNNGSGYTAPQLASGRGFLTPEFERFLELAETENETWPWREFFRRQEHGHRFGRVKGVLNVVRQAILPTPR